MASYRAKLYQLCDLKGIFLSVSVLWVGLLSSFNELAIFVSDVARSLCQNSKELLLFTSQSSQSQFDSGVRLSLNFLQVCVCLESQL